MSSLLKRHSTLLAFTLSIASSVAFVACGDDDPNAPATEDGGSGGKGTGGKASGGSGGGSGGTATGGSKGGAGGGPTTGGKGGVPVEAGEGGPIDSNGDAASDASDD
jgi:hypothetical protein